MRTADQIVRDSREFIEGRGDDKEYLDPDEALILKEAGATDLDITEQRDGTFLINFEFQGVRFVTVTSQPWT